MRLKKLYLAGWRNYVTCEFTPHPELNFVVGANAAGKTNLVEAVYYLYTGESWRAAREDELINWEAERAQLVALIGDNGHELKVTATIGRGGQKTLILGQRRVGKHAIRNALGAVLFTPWHLNLVQGAPRERRRYLDLELGSWHPSYGRYYEQYYRILHQRNACLRDVAAGRASHTLLDVWDEQIAIYGARLLAGRLQVLKAFSPLAVRFYRELTAGAENLDLRYAATVDLGGACTEDLLVQRLRSRLLARRHEDILRGVTITGPHRDELVILINGHNARSYASQGQQRTIVCAFKLAELEMALVRKEKRHIMLLDDVLSELDPERQHFLLRAVLGKTQVFITSSQPCAFAGYRSRAKLFDLRDAQLREVW